MGVFTMGKEIERKWLIQDDISSLIFNKPYTRITQAYLTIQPEIRIRCKKESFAKMYTLTIKSKGDLARNEEEIQIPEPDYNNLMNKIDKQPLHKRRYVLDFDDYIGELDFYLGKMTGLKVLEVEFDSKDEANQFNLADYINLDYAEVTDTRDFKNAELFQHEEVPAKITSLYEELNNV